MNHQRIYDWVKNECVPNIIEEYKNGRTNKTGIKDVTKITLQNPELNVDATGNKLIVNLKSRRTIEIRYFKERRLIRPYIKDEEGNVKRVSLLSTLKKIPDLEDPKTLEKIYTKTRLIDSSIFISILQALSDSKLKAKTFKNPKHFSTVDYSGIDIDIQFDKKVFS